MGRSIARVNPDFQAAPFASMLSFDGREFLSEAYLRGGLRPWPKARLEVDCDMRALLFIGLGTTLVLAMGVALAAAPVLDTPALFIRGDTNRDGAVDLGDVIYSLNYLFLGSPAHCLIAHDANDDELVDLGDAIYIATYLFADGPAPPAPFPSCGFDHTPSDALSCDVGDTTLCTTRP